MASKRWLSLVGLLLAATAALAEAPLDSPSSPPELPTSVPASDPFSPETRAWLKGEYLLWKIQGESLPVMVGAITTEQAEKSQTLPPGTIRALFGGSAGGGIYDMASGGRLSGGYWLLPDEGLLAVEGSAFLLTPGRQHNTIQSAGYPALGPVFTDASTGQEILIMSAIPGLRTGWVDITQSNRLWGAELEARHRLGGEALPLDLLVGVRYLEFDESLDVSGASTAVPNGHLPCG